MITFKQFLDESSDPCWKGYRQLGTKKKNGKEVPNCIPEENVNESGGELVYRKGDDHIEKYGDTSYAVYLNGKKQAYYDSLEDAKTAIKNRSSVIPEELEIGDGFIFEDGTEGEIVYIQEAEYQGRDVPLGKPMAGDVKKSKVYVKNEKGNVVKVEFGDPNMTIKKHIPERRKSFRARHNCDNPGPKTKARYWSCKKW